MWSCVPLEEWAWAEAIHLFGIRYLFSWQPRNFIAIGRSPVSFVAIPYFISITLVVMLELVKMWKSGICKKLKETRKYEYIRVSSGYQSLSLGYIRSVPVLSSGKTLLSGMTILLRPVAARMQGRIVSRRSGTSFLLFSIYLSAICL